MLNVSGHRLGTAEMESALVAHEAVAEAAVVGFPHPIKGQGIYAYVILTAEFAGNDSEQVKGALKEQVRHAIGAFAAPDVVHVASGLPKTRSGKIMRRILRKIAASEYDGLGDVTHAGGARGGGAARPGAQGGPRLRPQSWACTDPSSSRVRISFSRVSCPSSLREQPADSRPPRRVASGLGAGRPQLVQAGEQEDVVAAEACARVGLVGGEIGDLLEEPRALLLVEVGAQPSP